MIIENKWKKLKNAQRVCSVLSIICWMLVILPFLMDMAGVAAVLFFVDNAWIIPFAFVAYLPASYFLKPEVNAFSTIGVECVLAVVFFAIAYLVFTLGTRAYESAGN